MPCLLHCDFTYAIFYSFFGFLIQDIFAIAGTVAHIADGSDIWKPRIYTDPQSHSASIHIAGQH